MDLVHRFALHSTPEIREELGAHGIEVASQGIVWFEIGESDPRWPHVRSWAAARKPFDLVRARFSQAEVDRSQWVALASSWYEMYPAPKDLRGYRRATYDLGNWCPECGTGAVQDRPFLLKGEPKWGAEQMLRLNWVHDELFVKPALWESLFAPLGVRAQQVLDYTSRKPLKTIVQLVVGERVSLTSGGEIQVYCKACRATKYSPKILGPLAPLAQQPTAHLAKTTQYFGDVAAADQKILLSRSVVEGLGRIVADNLSFQPVLEEAKA